MLHFCSDYIVLPSIIYLISYMNARCYRIFACFLLGPFVLPQMRQDMKWHIQIYFAIDVTHLCAFWFVSRNSVLSCLQAFAWWPELLAEHAEKFLSLYSVDMDSALEAQPQDSWDSFPLFQLLNNALRNDSKILRFLFIVHTGFLNVPTP